MENFFIDKLNIIQEHKLGFEVVINEQGKEEVQIKELPAVGKEKWFKVNLRTQAVTESVTYLKLEGSYSSSITIRCDGHRVECYGNPSRYGRIDNLYGYKTIDECVQVYNVILVSLGLPAFTKCTDYFFSDSRDGQEPQKQYNGALITHIDFTLNGIAQTVPEIVNGVWGYRGTVKVSWNIKLLSVAKLQSHAVQHDIMIKSWSTGTIESTRGVCTFTRSGRHSYDVIGTIVYIDRSLNTCPGGGNLLVVSGGYLCGNAPSCVDPEVRDPVSQICSIPSQLICSSNQNPLTHHCSYPADMEGNFCLVVYADRLD